MSTNAPRPTKAERKEAARDKARRMREEAEARQRRNRRLAIAGAVIGVLLVVVAVGAIVQAGRSNVSDATAVPSGLVDNGVRTGPADAPEVAIYLDYACPACAQYEAQDGEWLVEKAEAGEIALVHKPIAILDRYSTTEFSTRAASAAACVGETSPEAFAEFNRLMFVNQVAEEGPGMTNEEIWSIAEAAGADPEAEQCVLEERYTGWAANATDAASQAGVQGTPTVMVEGEILQDRSREAVEAAVAAAG